MEDLVNQTLVVAAAADEQEDENSLFKRLPDELIISQILDKICEAKSLCICSLVSKHFSSLVYQTKTVSLKIPLQIPNLDPNPTTRLACYPQQPLHCLTISLRFFAPLQRAMLLSSAYVAPMSNLTAKFLAKFTRLESLYVEFDYPAEPEANGGISSIKEPVMKWMIDVSSDSFMLLIPPGRVDDDGDVINIFVENDGFRRAQFYCHLSIAFWTLSLMEKLFSFLPESLLHVVITDSKNRGKLVLGETDVVQMRTDSNRRNATNSEDGGDEEMFRFLDVPVIEAASSARPMDFATLFLDKDRDTEADYLMVRGVFEYKREVLVEGVMELLKEVKASL